jgi:drug/metabolite transporter (DMT)-like permease
MAVNPVLITLGAALILGERFGPRRAAGVVVALIGALIIIRPGSDVFSPFAVLPFLAAIAYSGYALATRFVGRDESAWTSLLYTAAFGAVALTLAVPFFWVPPDPLSILLMCSLGLTGGLGHFCVIRAFMAAEAGTVAPFAYCGPIFAMFWGMVVFAEFPDALTYVGALVIIAAGIYVWHRETRVAVEAPAE